MRFAACVFLSATLLASLPAQAVNTEADKASLTVPFDYDSVDASGVAFWFLTPFRSHHQLLLDEAQLWQAKGSTLRSLSVRRNAGDRESSESGTLWVEITLSHSPRAATSVSDRFADNRGGDSVRVFEGPLALSESGALDGEVPTWIGSDALTIAFQVPFQYQGGTLCIETRTRPHADQSGDFDLPWWPIDARIEQLGGSVETFGASCIADMPGMPADAEAGSFVTGSTANFYLRGRRSLGLSYCFLGDDDQTAFGLPLPISLQFLGMPCSIYIEPQSVMLVMPERLPGPRQDRVVANARMAIPSEPSMIGKEIFAQWMVREPGAFPRFAFSNAVKVRIAGSSIGSGLSWLESTDPAAETGQILAGRAPVLRFSH